MLGLSTTTLNFEILDNDNINTLLFLDTSIYSEPPENPILEIVLPGSSKYLLTQIQPQKINVLNSYTIGLNDIFTSDCPVILPDGIYTLVYKVCPYDYLHIKKYNLRTTLLDREIYQIYANLDLVDCFQDNLISVKKDLMDIYILIESAKANASLGYLDKANKDYQIASKKVSKLTDKIIK